MEFQRARSEDQRRARREAILETASGMLEEMRVSELSLNELSRRTGLAKTPLLKYFESREAVLLQLLDRELREWAEDFSASDLVGGPGAIADRFARSLAARPVLCDLISAQASVLERNISTEVALAHKRATAPTVALVVTSIERWLPELDAGGGYRFVAYGLLLTSAMWPSSRPSEALQAAYDADAEVAKSQMDLVAGLADALQLMLRGLLAG